MMQVRPSKERGRANYGWLDSRHSFSFGEYYDRKHMGFRALRVINDDRVLGGGGFPPHPHRDMEILSYVVDGAMEHRDSMGNGSIIRAGDLQRMSAGTGVVHSEFNHSSTAPLRFLQIWILPERRGLTPGYEQKSFSLQDRKGRLCLLASPDGDQGSLRVHQDLRLYASVLGPGQEIELPLAEGRYAWVQLVDGSLELEGQILEAGDGCALAEVPGLALRGREDAHFLVFDLA